MSMNNRLFNPQMIAEIEEAKEKWNAQLFDKIPGDEVEFVPYPTLKK